MLMRSGFLYQTVHSVYFVHFCRTWEIGWVRVTYVNRRPIWWEVRKIYKGSGVGRLCAGVWSDGREQENATCPSHTSAPPVQSFTPPRSWEVNLSIYQSIPQVDAQKPSNTPNSTIRKGLQLEGLGCMSTIQVESKQKNKKKDKEGQIPKKEELKVAPVLED